MRITWELAMISEAASGRYRACAAIIVRPGV